MVRSDSDNEREEAIRVVLETIQNSRGDEAVVFDVILQKAAALCDAPYAALNLVDETHSHLVYTASYGPELTASRVGETRWPLSADNLLGAAILSGEAMRITDMKDTDAYRAGDPVRVMHVDDDGIRSFMTVPLLSGGRAIGSFGLIRRKVAPFSQSDLRLVRTFAAHAVIAIENARQFRDLQNRLEREAATNDILGVISTSRDAELPVFEMIIEKSAHLCNCASAALVLGRPEDKILTMAAEINTSKAARDRFRSGGMPMDPDQSFTARAILLGKTIHLPDMKDTPEYRDGCPPILTMVDDAGIRSTLFVPLVASEGPIGALVLFKNRVAPFSEDEIGLVRAFAAQAVIAIDNVRQFRELQIRLEREAATRDILTVISKSRDDDDPVFATILDSAARLCDAAMSRLLLVDETRTHYYVAASWGDASWQWDVGIENKAELHPELPAAQAIFGNKVVIIDDLRDSPAYRNKRPVPVRLVDEENVRSVALVPLESNGQAIGCIVVSRRDDATFAEDEISLVKTFADQAVIAIENVRQFKALETLNTELGDRVTQQVGEIERMGRLKRFLPAAVADTVVSSGSEELLKSHRSLLGVLFCDIRGFTAFCETAEPEETIEVLQTYHQEMGKLIDGHGAGVDHRMGDGIMVLFNDPLPCDDPAGDALRLAIAMRAQMAELSKTWKKLGHRLGFGVGVSLGYATVGMVGYEGRYDYTASGTAVNLAARLCDRAEDGEILLSPRARNAVEDEFATETCGEISLKGIHAPVEVFRLRS